MLRVNVCVDPFFLLAITCEFLCVSILVQNPWLDGNEVCGFGVGPFSIEELERKALEMQRSHAVIDTLFRMSLSSPRTEDTSGVSISSPRLYSHVVNASAQSLSPPYSMLEPKQKLHGSRQNQYCSYALTFTGLYSSSKRWSGTNLDGRDDMSCGLRCASSHYWYCDGSYSRTRVAVGPDVMSSCGHDKDYGGYDESGDELKDEMQSMIQHLCVQFDL